MRLALARLKWRLLNRLQGHPRTPEWLRDRIIVASAHQTFKDYLRSEADSGFPTKRSRYWPHQSDDLSPAPLGLPDRTDEIRAEPGRNRTPGGPV